MRHCALGANRARGWLGRNGPGAVEDEPVRQVVDGWTRCVA